MNPRALIYLLIVKYKRRKLRKLYREDIRRQALTEVREWCFDQMEKHTVGPDCPAYHIYRSVAEHIEREMK